MGVVQLYVTMLTLFAAGALAALLAGGRPRLANLLAHGAAAAGSLLAVGTAVAALSGGGAHLSLTAGIPLAGPLTIRIDPLAAFFLLTLGLVGAAVSLYAIGYAQEDLAERFAGLAACYNAFLLAMALVFTLSHVLYFLIAWEFMAVVSFLLVNHESDRPGTTAAAYKYIVMTTLGTVFVTAAFLILGSAAGSLDFAAFAGAELSGAARSAAFLCALVGFGTKAGLMPLHVWLPDAHPAAPSHVSALMSGVMLKTAIYGMMRFFLEFLGAGPAWWGWTVLAVAIVSAFMGVLYALSQTDLKRLLAYSSVENVGIALLGVGAALLFRSAGHDGLAGLALSASLYHVIGHAIFKSLMFMGAGAVLHATHTRNMDRLGGLIKRMPHTAPLILVGSVAIAALPPLNGFVSEWLTFQSLFALPAVAGGIAGYVAAVLLIALLGTTGALAAATFVKAFGVSFLGKPRSEQAERAEEVPAVMRWSMGLLAACTVVLGVWPNLLLGLMQPVVAGYTSGAAFSGPWWAVAFQAERSGGSLAMPVLAAMLAVGLVAAAALARLRGTPRVVSGEVWSCGMQPTAVTQYTGEGFTQPIQRAFGSLLRPLDQVVPEFRAGRYHGVAFTFQRRILYFWDRWVYQPVVAALVWAAERTKPLQCGSLQLYIGYIMAVTVILLIVGTR